jgi:hypothetical protein
VIQTPADRCAGGQGREQLGPANNMAKIVSEPRSGRIGNVVYALTRYGQVAKAFVPPRNPRTSEQQAVRGKFAYVTGRWRILTPEQRAAWRIASADSYTIARLGREVALNPYCYFCRINFCRSDLGLSLFDIPPAVPSFPLNQVGELQITNTADIITIRLHVPVLPVEHTVVQGASPRSTGVSCVQHFPNLGFLPPSVDGWSDITALYVAWYGVPPVGKAVWIRTRQHINGWNDLPKQTSAVVPPSVG